jgi:uncharacterized protein (TIGR01777 family)
MKLVLAGATGFIGRHLVDELLPAKNEVTVLSRHLDRARKVFGNRVDVQQWDAVSVGEWASALDGADAVINLAGESIGAGRWTAKRKTRIIDSRVNATRALVSAMERASRRPGTLINASAVGYYGPMEDRDVTEDAPPGQDFLAETVQRWEAEALKAESFGVRVVCARFGVVLGRDGGALPRMLLPFQLFVGGHLGSGRQPFAWVHIADATGALRFSLENSAVRGPINVVGTQIVTMKEFCKTLGRVVGRPSWAPVPAFVLRLALGEMADMLLTGQRVVPKRLLDAGYPFRFPTLEEALRDLVG